MSRHIEGDNVVFPADILESDRVVGLMAVKDEQPVATNCTLSVMLNKMQ
jgi:hypothetical protein